jgi:hypothetical protein
MQLWFWGRPHMRPAGSGFAVRCDYPALGVHEFVGFRRSYWRTLRFARRDAAFYRRGPLRMVHSVVVMSLRDFDVHARRPSCRAPECPGSSWPVAGVSQRDRVVGR